MTDRRAPVSRRALMAALAAGGVAGVTSALSTESADGSLYGGKMALSQAYNVSDDLWIGPDSARSNVDAESGRVYIGASGDGYTFYHGDGGVWTAKGLGDSADPLPSVTTDKANIDDFNSEVWVEPDDETQGIADAISNNGPDVAVCLESGTYRIQDATFDNPGVPVGEDNVGIFGQGPSTLLYLPDSTTDTDKGHRMIHVGGGDSSDWQGTSDVRGFVLRDLRIDMNYQNQGNIDNLYDGHAIGIQGSHWQVSNVEVVNSTGDGIEPISRANAGDGLPQTRHGSISDFHARDSYEHNLHLHGCMDVTVTNFHGIGEHNYNNVTLFSDNTDNRLIKISNSHFIGSDGSSEAYGMDIDTGTGSTDVYDLVIDNCTIKDNNDGGIYINGNSAKDVTITGGTRVIGNGGIGVTVIGANGLVIDETVEIRENDEDGMRIEDAADGVEDVVVEAKIKENNQGSVGARGIECRQSGNGPWNDVRLSPRILSPSTPKHKQGIFFNSNGSSSISNVSVEDAYIPLDDLQGSAGALVFGWHPTHVRLSNQPVVPLDVTNLASEKGNEAYNDGTSGSEGPHVYDGTNWVGYGPASGSSI